jgi:hypothetical protein
MVLIYCVCWLDWPASRPHLLTSKPFGFPADPVVGILGTPRPGRRNARCRTGDSEKVSGEIIESTGYSLIKPCQIRERDGAVPPMKISGLRRPVLKVWMEFARFSRLRMPIDL